VAIKKAVLRKGILRITLSCPASAPAGCTGMLRLRPSRGKGSFGSTSFTLAAGKTLVAQLKLTAAAKRKLARGKLVAKLVAEARSGATPVKTTAKQLSLRA
jgi:hypothetical protein